MAAVGAVLMAARLNSGSPNYGVGLELQAIAAAARAKKILSDPFHRATCRCLPRAR